VGLFDFIIDSLLRAFLPDTPWRWFVRAMVILLVVIAFLVAQDRGVFS
jgi:hypothetical protein